MTVTVPVDAGQNTQASFRQVIDELRQLRSLVSSINNTDVQRQVDDLKKTVQKQALGPVYSTWQEVFGATVPEPIRVVATFTTTVGNVGTGEDILATYTSKAGEMFRDGMCYRGIFWGKTANNANAKTVRARLLEGANNTIMAAVALTISEAGHWLLGFAALRKDSGNLRAGAQALAGPANGPASKSGTNVTQPTATLTNAIELRVTGEAVADNDITMEGGVIALVSPSP